MITLCNRKEILKEKRDKYKYKSFVFLLSGKTFSISKGFTEQKYINR